MVLMDTGINIGQEHRLGLIVESRLLLHAALLPTLRLCVYATASGLEFLGRLLFGPLALVVCISHLDVRKPRKHLDQCCPLKLMNANEQ